MDIQMNFKLKKSFLKNKKAQGLPMSTIVIIILVVIVLVAVGLMFFTNLTSGQSGIESGKDVAEQGASSFKNSIDWEFGQETQKTCKDCDPRCVGSTFLPTCESDGTSCQDVSDCCTPRTGDSCADYGCVCS